MQTRNVVYRFLVVVTLLALLLGSVPGTVGLAVDSYEEGGGKSYPAPRPVVKSVDSATNGWDTQLVADIGYEIGDTSLALDSSGYPHIAYYDYTNRNLLYAYYDGTSWHTETVHSADRTGNYPSIALDSNDQPHIAWLYYTPSYSVVYGYHDGSSWHIETASSGSWPRYISLALDSNDHPRISYFTDVDGGPHPDSLMYAWHDGSSWHIEQVDGTVVQANQAIFTALRLDALDRPHIAYSNGFDLVTKYAWKDTSWHLDTVYDDGQVYGEVAVALDSSGHPHIVQTDRTRDTLWYFRQDGSSWHAETLGTVAHGRGDPSIALDASDDVHIGYPDLDGNIKYAHHSGGEWTIETVAAGQAPALALGVEDVPHVSYYDDVAGELRYASRGASGPSITSVYVDLRVHGPDPETTIALVEQPVVWTNNGTRTHTVTEGDPIFHIYLPVVLRGMGASAAHSAGATTFDPDYTPVFDSSPIAPGEQFTYTFTSTGVFTYYSTFSPGRVVGEVVVVQPGETVSEDVEMGSAATVSTTSGASLEIGAGALLTDTVASITEFPEGALEVEGHTAVGGAYDFDISHFYDVVSEAVTITLPFDPGLVPVGTDSQYLEIAYHNGVDWIEMRGTVDLVRHTISISTTHLSTYIPIVSCWEAITGYSTQDIEDYNRAKEFLNDAHRFQDLYEAFTTSDGQPFFRLAFEARNADWLRDTSPCRVYASNSQEIKEALGITATGPEVFDKMVDLGHNMHATTSVGETYVAAEVIVELLCSPIEGLHVIELLELNVIPAVLMNALKSSIFMALDFRLAGKMAEMEDDIADLLSHADEAAQSGLVYRPKEIIPQFEMPDGTTCGRSTGYEAGLYEYEVLGAGYPSQAFGNIVVDAESDDPYFVLGLQDAEPFHHGAFWGKNYSDRVFIMLEYKDVSGNTQIAIAPFKNYLGGFIFPLCRTFAAMVSLPNAVPGTEVKVKYILEEKGHLDTDYYYMPNGVSYPIETMGEHLYYHPPNAPTNPTPVDGATDQDTTVDLSWSLDNPNGRPVTYDVYFEPADEDNVPDVLASDDQTESTYDPGTLNPNTTYIWQVIATDDRGLAVAGPVWDFATGTGGGPSPGEMVTVPAGEFQMGCDDSNPNEHCYSDEQPLHTVYLDAYTIDKYEVTNAQYANFLNAEGNQEEGGVTWLDADSSYVRIHESGGVWQADAGYADHPVVEVTWYGARACCQWQGKRLPTEAEWEKAARGSSDTRMYPWGNESPDCSRLNYRHYNGSSYQYCVGDTSQVGSYPTGASPYGAMDMSGNVWELVNDWYLSNYYDSSPYSNPPGPGSGSSKVLRGGCWGHDWYFVRVAYRSDFYPLDSVNYLGFRCAGVAPGAFLKSQVRRVHGRGASAEREKSRSVPGWAFRSREAQPKINRPCPVW